MVLGFLGKGGSGKSTAATQMALWLRSSGQRVLAIDAEERLFLLVEELIAIAAHGRAEYPWIEKELKTFIDRAVHPAELVA